MNKEEFKKDIKELLNQIQIELSDEQIEKFYNYMNELLEWNTKINLTAITDPKEVILKHFVDSLTIDKYVKNTNTMIDVGTGAGFPGIPIKISNDNLQITLLDSLNKRILFLEDIINKLELQNIQTIHLRAEEAGNNKKYRESYDIAISRAVAQLNILSEYLLPLVKIGGKVICMKGSNVQEELEQAQKAIEILGGEIEKVEKFSLPNTDMERNIIIIKKIKNSPLKYPRKAGTPSKEPIQ